MILASLGKLSTDQALTDGAADSENVIQLFTDGAGVDYGHWTDFWFLVDTKVVDSTGGTSSTYKFALVLAKEAAMNNIKEVCAVTVTGVADKRIATVGRHIAALNVGKMVKDMLETDGSDYEFLGMISTLANGNGTATLTVDANLSFTEPRDLKHRMTVDSNIDNSIDVASAGSGA